MLEWQVEEEHAQVLDGPPYRGRAEFSVESIDIDASLDQELSKRAVPTEGSVVKGCRAKFVSD